MLTYADSLARVHNNYRLSREHKWYNKTRGIHARVDSRTRPPHKFTNTSSRHALAQLHVRAQQKARERRPLTAAPVKLPHKKILLATRNVDKVYGLARVQNNSRTLQGKQMLQLARGIQVQVANRRSPMAHAHQCKLKACTGLGAQTPIGKCTGMHKCLAKPCWHEWMLTPVCALVCMHKNSADAPPGTQTLQQTGWIPAPVDNRRLSTAQVYQHELKACTGEATGMNTG